MFFGFVDQKSNKNSNAVDTKAPDSLFTQIGQETEIEASIKTKKTIRIGGKVTGNVQSDEKIILSSTGELHGECSAPIIEVSGKIAGKIFAKKSLILNGSSSVQGEIYAKQFVVNEGAYIDGNITSGDNVLDVDEKVVYNDSSVQKKMKETSNKQIQDSDKTSTVTYKRSKNYVKEVTAEPIISGDGNRASSNRVISNILLGIPGNNIEKTSIKEIKLAAGNFMEALGFTFEIFDEPTYNPFYQHLTYVMDRNDQNEKKNLTEVFSTGKKALEDVFLDRNNGHMGEKILKSAKSLKSSLEKVEELSVTLGGIILVKTTNGNRPIISAELISPELHNELKNNPKMVTQPSEIYFSLYN
ncbi:bactofilin family protein [Gracilimonas sp. Q87]|uniref:bactofilin family protein n=1 Tax=Gracilimonas sp. Q87 TaxID=3384766 RepID=UPI003983E040